jgi:hypothetical protein
VIEVNGRVRIPKPLLKSFARYNFAWLFKQGRQQFEGLALKPDADAGTTQLSGLQIGIKDSELYPLGCAANRICCHVRLAHPAPQYTGKR